MSEPGLKNAMSNWLEEHIECVAHPIVKFKAPYTPTQLTRMQAPCAQLKLMYDFVDRFNIDIHYKVYDKYEGFARISF